MYTRILVPLENSRTDACIVEHVSALARANGATIVLIHVADGFAARNLKQLDLQDSEEMLKDRDYIERICAKLTDDGLECESLLATGNPANEITDAAVREKCDLIAMATHGHKFLNDLIRGSVADSVRHNTMIPVLLVRSPPAA